MKRPISNLTASVRARLANLAREQERPFQEVLQFYAMERFLYRLAQSRHSTNFLLKGALLFYSQDAALSRPTRDIDLEGLASNSGETLAAIIREICRQRVEPDGMEYDADGVRVDDTQQTAEYQGMRVRFF
jgi:Nucleotidyl transferase AbiEii toxin, Type IV TA system